MIVEKRTEGVSKAKHKQGVSRMASDPDDYFYSTFTDE